MKIFCYKISKYNPKNYKDGAYQLDEWTDFSDIGKVFESGIFTMEEYLKVEKNYIDFILNVVKEKKINSFLIKELEDYDNVIWQNMQNISIVQLEQLLRDCLRNRCWCKIFSEKFCLCFGYDFYIHICCDMTTEPMSKICNEFSLFLQDVFSRVCELNK